LESRIAGQRIFVEHRHPGLVRIQIHKGAAMVGYAGRRVVQRYDEALAFVDRHVDDEVTKTNDIAVEQSAWITLAQWFTIAIDINTIGTGIGEVIGTALEIDRGVAARNESIRVREDPVVLQRSANRAAFVVKDAHGVVADKVSVFADDFELQCHDRPMLQRNKALRCGIVHIISSGWPGRIAKYETGTPYMGHYPGIENRRPSFMVLVTLRGLRGGQL
jgi:hypothetical protein